MFSRDFLANLYLFSSCYACPLKCNKSGSDITLGDYWGITSLTPQLNDDLCSKNMLHSCKVLILRTTFWAEDGKTFHEKIKACCSKSFSQKVKRKAYQHSFCFLESR